MKNEGVKTKIYAGVVTILLLTAMTGVGVLYDMRGDLQSNLNSEKLNSEKLLSEKLKLDKEIFELTNRLREMGGKNSELLSQLDMASNKVAQQDKTINKLQKENNNLKGIKKEVDAMKKLRDQLQAEVDALKSSNQTLADANSEMKKSLKELEAENDALKEKLKNAAVLKAGNFRVDVLRKNQSKLTVKARKTHEVSVSFDLPKSAMATLGKNNLYMVITSPSGKPVADEGAAKKVVLPEGVKTEITPTVTKEIDLGKGPQRLTIAYSPDGDMEQGIYKVELYTEDLYLGSSQFRLMK